AANAGLRLANPRGERVPGRPAAHPGGRVAGQTPRRRPRDPGADRRGQALNLPAFLHDCPAPAKLNLHLHVTGRRGDGYRALEPVFELVALADQLDFRRRDDGRIEMPSPLPGIDPDHELCLRAARLLAAASGVRSGVDITVRKRIPMGAGLGGGSSDAATTLLALNRLWGIGWPAQRLAEPGLRLGARGPVSVHGRPAYATGIGDGLDPIDTRGLPTRHYPGVMPPVTVPPAVVFGEPRLT